MENAAVRIVNTLKPWHPTWTIAVELAVHVQARAFGFQVFNASQEETQKGLCIPACSGLAADHLLQLLRDRTAVIVSEGAGPLEPATFFKSIQSLHAAYFATGPYMEWKRKSNVALLDRQFQQLTYSHSIKKQAAAHHQQQRAAGASTTSTFVGVASSPEWLQQLAELSLFFLLWTEAANLRHTPELLWLLYHIMLSSNNQAKALSLLEAPGSHYSLTHWLSVGQQQQSAAEQDQAYADALERGFVRGVLLPARNRHGNAMRLGGLLLDGPNPYGTRHSGTQGVSRSGAAGSWWLGFSPTSLAERQCDGLRELKARGVINSNGAAWTLSEMVEADLAFYGDGCIVLDMVIQPVFNLMAEQIGLMGAAGEQPALRLGYDDFNESACIDDVLATLSKRLEHEVSSGADPWDRLLLFFDKHAAETARSLQQSGNSDSGYRPVTFDMLQRYPRDFRRLGKLAGMLKAILRPAAAAADGNHDAAVGPAAGLEQSGASSVGGSAPVGHLLASLRVTDKLWAKLFKKSFIETRSLGAVTVAFSRLLIMHAVLLCWMSLWGYMIPAWTPSSMFTGAFWAEHGLKVAECASWGLFVHAVLHVVKDLVIFHLLSTPKALRVQENAGDQNPVLQDAKDAADAGFMHRKKQQLKLWWEKQWRAGQLKEGDMVLVQPPVHPGKILKGHNVITLLFWLLCAFILLDSHIPSWPLHRTLSKMALFSRGTARGVVMPVWAMAACVYAGLWVLHQFWKLVADSLPDRLASKLGPLARKDGRRAAEHFFPYGNMHNSQNFKRYLVNCLLWVVVFTGKFFFDFFVILKPLAQGPAVKLLSRLDATTPWTEWAESILLVWSFWVASAFLVFYDTGLFWQLVGALYSTLVLGMHRRVGHVKTWYDLTWSFPRLSHKLAQRMLPAAATALPSRPFSDEPNISVIEAAAAAAIQHTESLERHPSQDNEDSSGGGGGASLPFPLQALPCCLPSEVLFAQAWDKVVDDLRARDLLSNAEAGRLKYELISIAPDPTAGAWMLLPRFVAAGAAVEAVHLGVSSASQIDAVCRSFNLLAWLLHSLNLITHAQLSSMLLAKSVPPKARSGALPRKASHRDVEKAAEVLKDSKELLQKLKSKLQDTATAVSLADVDTQLLLEATMKGLRVLKGPNTVDIAAAAAPKGWQQQRQVPLQIISWLLDMLTLTRGQTAPATPEAVRVLCFFATSLNNPKMPTAANVACSRSMTTLTPHYGEDVMYALSQATAAAEMKMAAPKGDEDGSTFLINSRGDPTETLKYLRVSYKLEWRNFVERLLTRADVAAHFRALQEVGQAVPVQADVTHADFTPGAALHPWLHEALSWASMRGQLLQRTVHGMMYYETALQQLILMQAKTQLAEEAYRVAAEVGIPLRKRNDWVACVVDTAALLMARQKYAYVVSSQALGELQFDGKVSKRWLAHCIRTVIAGNYPHLRIAYLDWENLGAPPKAQAAAAAAPDGRAAGAADVAPRNRTKGGGAHKLLRQYSVLLQWSQEAECVQEQYRVRLPINLETDTGVILGEGKPENQNHAVIFCHSETLQTIDCNQDSYLVEALKLPNLLAEFDGHHGKAAGIRGSIGSSKGKKLSGVLQHQGPALVGFREWVFSEDSGALAEFAAATERSFGTTVQRVMHNPGACRFHYGHPDVWCKLFTMTNGGVSKATKALHVSEDVFGGYNVMLRGRDITYVDYIAVGKGRDMGFETINTFEAKIAGGNGEQVVSRDVHRLARRLNTARLLTWYHTGNGFFINTSLLMYSLLVNAWLCLLLALSGSSSVGGLMLQDSLALLGGLQLMQLGSLSILVYVATVWLEDGLLTTLKNVLKQLVSGSLLFYVFRGQTSAHAFRADLQYGGAKYLATGRGYKLKATPFMDVFQTYARSHMWFGGHLLLVMVTALCVGLPVSIFSLWSYALVILALLVAPFWFNPFAFDWDENKLAGREFLAWMAGHKPAGNAKPQLWREFNDGQLRQAADDDGVQLGRSLGSFCGLAYLLPSAIIIGYAVFYMLDSWWKSVILVLSVNALIGVLLACWSQATRLEAVKGAAVLSRAVKFVLKFLVLAGLVTLFAFLVRPQQRWLGRAVVRILYVEFELARLTSRVLLAFLPHYQPARRLVNVMCWLGDFALGLLLLLLLFIGSLFGLLTRYQAAVLFSMGYAASYLAEKRLEDSEVGRLAKELQELQKRERLANQPNSKQQQQPPKPPPATGAAPGTSHTNSVSNQGTPGVAGGATDRQNVTAFAAAAAAATTSRPSGTVAGAQPTPRSDSLPVHPDALIQQIAEYCQTLQEEASNSSSMDLPADREHSSPSARSASTSPGMPAAAGVQAGPLRAAAAGGCSVTRGAAVTAAAAASTAAACMRRSSCTDAAGDTADDDREQTGPDSTEPTAKGWSTPPVCIASDRSSTGSAAHEEAWGRVSAAFLQVSSTGGPRGSTGGSTAVDADGMLSGSANEATAVAGSDVGAHCIQQADEWVGADGDLTATGAAADDADSADGSSAIAGKQPPVVTRIESAVGRTWD